jgi:predicted GIY-YIG superfamily endonuclease
MPKHDPQAGLVYLLHFDAPFKHAAHYIGFVESPDGLENRLEQHRTGRGAALMAAVSAAGISFTLAKTWAPASRTFERELKNRKKASQLCPICRAAAQAAKEEAKHA